MSSLNYLKQELKKIKIDGASFLGMDGGNIEADVWVCGVEFGSDLKEMESYYNKYVLTYEKDGYDVPFREACPDVFVKSIYDRYLSAIYISIFNNDDVTLSKHPKYSKIIDKVLKSELYNKSSSIFKLNLYPLAKKDMSWDKNIETQLSITKQDYYNGIFNNRIAFIKNLAKTFNPKIIICTSPKGYENTFVEAFLNNHQQVKFSYSYLSVNKKQFRISVYDNDTTKIIVVPFLGRGNLSSYQEVISMANYLAKTYTDDLPF